MATTTEAERKYDVPGEFTLPDLSRLPAVAEVGEPAEHRLDATYYDTPGLRLAANRVTLRRRMRPRGPPLAVGWGLAADGCRPASAW